MIVIITLDCDGYILLLRNEEGVEIPETRINISTALSASFFTTRVSLILPARRHLHEALMEEDLAELLANLHQRVQCTRSLVSAQRIEVVVLEIRSLP
jgi:hypothetical protein